MQTAREQLNRIKWDTNEDPGAYTIGYEDRQEKRIIEIRYPEIIRLDEGFMVIGEEETTIPLHRIRYIKKKGAIIWQRPARPAIEAENTNRPYYRIITSNTNQINNKTRK